MKAVGKKKKQQNKGVRGKSKKMKLLAIPIVATLVMIVGTLIYQQFFNKLEASTIVKKGDFELTASNKWDPVTKKNYASLKWDDMTPISRNDYQWYQSEDWTKGTTVSEPFAEDRAVKDDVGPNAPDVPSIRAGKEGELKVRTNASDNGKEFQWYAEIEIENNKVKKSDTVRETITSNIAGYFYEISDSSTSSLKQTVEGYKDSSGLIDKKKYAAYIAPDDEALTYRTDASFAIPAERDSTQYLHVLAVDRANNVGEVTSNRIVDMLQTVDFEVERTKDELKVVNLNLSDAVDNKMKSMEIHFPKDAELKFIDGFKLPAGLIFYENSIIEESRSVSFAVDPSASLHGKLTLSQIKTIVNSIRISMTSNQNKTGGLELTFHERLLASWVDPNKVIHYYQFESNVEGKVYTWFGAYNSARSDTYRGLTGYLATLTSVEEHDFVFDNIAKTWGWLGGTRTSLKADGSKINNQRVISENYTMDGKKGDYINANEWYWASGPETGQVFYDKPTYIEGQEPQGLLYNGFNNKDNNLINPREEPNNDWFEGFLQFAQAKQGKYWNDLRADNGAIAGYYVEFSQYGDQVEVEEVTDMSWQAPIPQKVSLLGYDDQGNRLQEGDLIFEQSLMLNKPETATPKVIPLYEFIKLIDNDGNDHGFDYSISNDFQEGKLIYEQRAVNLFMRQVILKPNNKIPVPTQGSVRVESKDNVANKENKQIESGSNPSTVNFTATQFLLERNDEKLSVTPFNLGFYKVVGYNLTTIESDVHDEAAMVPINTRIEIDSAIGRKFWMTIYVEPDVNTAVTLSMVNDKLHVYYSNITSFIVYIDGEKYKTFDGLVSTPIIETKLLDIPLNQARNKVTVSYKNGNEKAKQAIWNDKEKWKEVTVE